MPTELQTHHHHHNNHPAVRCRCRNSVHDVSHVVLEAIETDLLEDRHVDDNIDRELPSNCAAAVLVVAGISLSWASSSFVVVVLRNGAKDEVFHKRSSLPRFPLHTETRGLVNLFSKK